jgi:hypothetical protein
LPNAPGALFCGPPGMLFPLPMLAGPTFGG